MFVQKILMILSYIFTMSAFIIFTWLNYRYMYKKRSNDQRLCSYKEIFIEVLNRLRVVREMSIKRRVFFVSHFSSFKKHLSCSFSDEKSLSDSLSVSFRSISFVFLMFVVSLPSDTTSIGSGISGWEGCTNVYRIWYGTVDLDSGKSQEVLDGIQW